jgi:hypothetical protein
MDYANPYYLVFLRVSRIPKIGQGIRLAFMQRRFKQLVYQRPQSLNFN